MRSVAEMEVNSVADFSLKSRLLNCKLKSFPLSSFDSCNLLCMLFCLEEGVLPYSHSIIEFGKEENYYSSPRKDRCYLVKNTYLPTHKFCFFCDQSLEEQTEI